MNHSDIVKQDVVGQYRRRLLATDDVRAFEEHLLGCAECQGLLEADAKLERGLLSRHSGKHADLAMKTSARVVPAYFAIAAAVALLGLTTLVQLRTVAVRSPQAGVPVYRLTITRNPVAFGAEIHVPSDAEWYLLELDAPAHENCCHVAIEDVEGRLVWKSDEAIMVEGGVVRVLLNRDYLSAGNYRVAVISTASGAARLVEHRVALKHRG